MMTSFATMPSFLGYHRRRGLRPGDKATPPPRFRDTVSEAVSAEAIASRLPAHLRTVRTRALIPFPTRKAMAELGQSGTFDRSILLITTSFSPRFLRRAARKLGYIRFTPRASLLP